METTPHKPKRRIFDFDELVKRLDEKKAKIECPICGHAQWVIKSGDYGWPNVLAWSNGRAEAYFSGFDVVALSCANCGFLRLHDVEMLGEDLLKEVD